MTLFAPTQAGLCFILSKFSTGLILSCLLGGDLGWDVMLEWKRISQSAPEQKTTRLSPLSELGGDLHLAHLDWSPAPEHACLCPCLFLSLTCFCFGINYIFFY